MEELLDVEPPEKKKRCSISNGIHVCLTDPSIRGITVRSNPLKCSVDVSGIWACVPDTVGPQQFMTSEPRDCISLIVSPLYYFS